MSEYYFVQSHLFGRVSFTTYKNADEFNHLVSIGRIIDGPTTLYSGDSKKLAKYYFKIACEKSKRGEPHMRGDWMYCRESRKVVCK